MKIKKTQIILLILVCVIIIGLFRSISSFKVSYRLDRGMRKVFEQNDIENKAREFAKSGKFKEALSKYEEAIQPEYLSRETDKATAMGALIHIHSWIQNYDEALRKVEWFFKNSVTGKPTESALEEYAELEALKKYQESGNPISVLEFINKLQSKWKNKLPPLGYDPTLVSTLLRLYNTIGDHDAGIKFIDECIEYFKQQDIKKYGKYKPGHADDEFLKVRAAFEQDKKESFKGCAKSKVGEVCMGRATKALIQSDYFPW